MRLVPLDAVGGGGADVEAVDVRADQEVFDPSRVLSDGRDHEAGADLVQHVGLGDFRDAGIGEEKFPVGERMIEVVAGDEGGQEVVHAVPADGAGRTRTDLGANVNGTGSFEAVGNGGVDVFGHRGIGKS